MLLEYPTIVREYTRQNLISFCRYDFMLKNQNEFYILGLLVSTNTTVTVISICDQSSAVVPIFRVPNNFIVRTLNEMKGGGT